MLDLRTLALTVLALVAFASNSLLCRAALRPGLIDAASFTSIRILTGAVTLAWLARAVAGQRRAAEGRAWPSALALFGYAAGFSFAYLRLDASAGALILFGTVQVTMNGWAIARGHAPSAAEWAGIAISVSGLLALTAPGLTAPDPLGAALMALAGIGWGAYSLLGRGAGDAIVANARSFARALPMALALSVLWAAAPVATHVEPRGALLATASGALTSGLGYAVWYAALRGLTATRAAIVQLGVPVLTALGGAVLLGERITPRLLVGGALILGGIGLAVLGAGRRSASP